MKKIWFLIIASLVLYSCKPKVSNYVELIDIKVCQNFENGVLSDTIYVNDVIDTICITDFSINWKPWHQEVRYASDTIYHRWPFINHLTKEEKWMITWCEKYSRIYGGGGLVESVSLNYILNNLINPKKMKKNDFYKLIQKTVTDRWGVEYAPLGIDDKIDEMILNAHRSRFKYNSDLYVDDKNGNTSISFYITDFVLLRDAITECKFSNNIYCFYPFFNKIPTRGSGFYKFIIQENEEGEYSIIWYEVNSYRHFYTQN